MSKFLAAIFTIGAGFLIFFVPYQWGESLAQILLSIAIGAVFLLFLLTMWEPFRRRTKPPYGSSRRRSF